MKYIYESRGAVPMEELKILAERGIPCKLDSSIHQVIRIDKATYDNIDDVFCSLEGVPLIFFRKKIVYTPEEIRQTPTFLFCPTFYTVGFIWPDKVAGENYEEYYDRVERCFYRFDDKGRKEQVHPFSALRVPGYKNFKFFLGGVYLCQLFGVEKNFYQAHLEPLGLGHLPILDKHGKPHSNWVQLKDHEIPVLKVKADPKVPSRGPFFGAKKQTTSKDFIDFDKDKLIFDCYVVPPAPFFSLDIFDLNTSDVIWYRFCVSKDMHNLMINTKAAAPRHFGALPNLPPPEIQALHTSNPYFIKE